MQVRLRCVSRSESSILIYFYKRQKSRFFARKRANSHFPDDVPIFTQSRSANGSLEARSFDSR